MGGEDGGGGGGGGDGVVCGREECCVEPCAVSRLAPVCEYGLRETDGTWDNGYTHAWTQVRAALRPRGIVHRKAPRV